MAEIKDFNSLKELVLTEYGEYGIWDEFHEICSEMEQRLSRFGTIVISADPEEYVQFMMSVELGFAKIICMADIMGLRPSALTVDAVLNSFAQKAMQYRDRKGEKVENATT